MNKFQKEVKRRTKYTLRRIGRGDLSYRSLVRFIRAKLKRDLKNDVITL